MANPKLNETQLKQVNKLLDKIRKEINSLSKKNPNLVFAFRRKIYKQLMYDERGTPMERRKLKEKMREIQKGKCAFCNRPLPKKGAELHRTGGAIYGYTEKNVVLICHACHIKEQKKKEYSD